VGSSVVGSGAAVVGAAVVGAAVVGAAVAVVGPAVVGGYVGGSIEHSGTFSGQSQASSPVLNHSPSGQGKSHFLSPRHLQ